MKHSLFFAASLLAVVCGVSACDDSSSSDDSCTKGTYKCDSNSLYACDGERWVQQEDCKTSTCSANLGQCVPSGEVITDECSSGSYACRSNDISKCENGHWKVVESCGTKKCSEEKWSCVEAEVVDPNPQQAETVTTESCSYNFVERCENEVAYFCNDDSKVTLRDCKQLKGTCHISKEGLYADCVETCSASDFKEYTTCEGDYVASHLCLETTDGGHYEYSFTDNKCAFGCENGKCKDQNTSVKEGGSCKEDTCADGNLYKCESGKYVLNACTGGTVCTMGDKPACTAKPKENAECNPSTFIDTCADGAIYYCHTDEKVVIKEACATGDGYSCHYTAFGQEYVSDGYAECAIPCSEGTEPLEQCVKDGDGYYTENYYCMMGSDGNWWYFPVQSWCSNGCDKAKGVCL